MHPWLTFSIRLGTTPRSSSNSYRPNCHSTHDQKCDGRYGGRRPHFRAKKIGTSSVLEPGLQTDSLLHYWPNFYARQLTRPENVVRTYKTLHFHHYYFAFTSVLVLRKYAIWLCAIELLYDSNRQGRSWRKGWRGGEPLWFHFSSFKKPNQIKKEES